jgi:hypothetical protein
MTPGTIPGFAAIMSKYVIRQKTGHGPPGYA